MITAADDALAAERLGTLERIAGAALTAAGYAEDEVVWSTGEWLLCIEFLELALTLARKLESEVAKGGK